VSERPIVAIRLRALGDVVLTTPALASLAAGHPGAPLHVVTESRFAPVLEGLPFVAKVWGIERTNASTLATLSGMRALRPALAVDFFGNARSAGLARFSGARRVWGYALRGREALYHATVPREWRSPDGRREHAAAVHLRLARAAGGAEVDPAPRIVVSDPARSEGARLLAQAGIADPSRTVGLVAAGSWATKTWPLAHSAMLARAVGEAGYGVLAITGPGEDAIAARLVALAPAVRVLPACGVAALTGVIAGLRAVVGTDSGPRHLAAALGVPSFAWFGPTHPDTWNPPGAMHGFWQTSLPCRACDRTACPHWSCLPGLGPDEGARLVLAHLAGPGRRA
jgi:ADP-heptose:LPS heptosyltransferase